MRNPTHADDAMWEELHAEFTEPELVELGHYIGFMSGGQRWLLTLHTQHGELAAEMDRRKKRKRRRNSRPRLSRAAQGIEKSRRPCQPYS